MVKFSEVIKKYTDKDSESFQSVLEKFYCDDRELLLQDIEEDCAAMVNQYINFWNKKDDAENIPVNERKPIKIYIDSNGGLIAQSLSIIDSIMLSKTPVWTINISCAYSSAFFVFIAGQRRIAYPHSSFLYHEGSVSNAGGDAAKFRNFADFYSKTLESVKKHILFCTNISEELYNEHIKDDWWISPEEALELGICDEIAKEII